MPVLRLPALFLCAFVAVAACSSTNGSSTCAGAPPVICAACCGERVAADACVDGAWTCSSRIGVACARCDADAGDSGADDASDDAACSGNPPVCTNCCGGAISVECQSGRWACPNVACPVCGSVDAANDAADGAAADGSTDDATACTGSAPYCFGNDSTRCCANDPGGRATCSGGQWLCGSAPAPGCNGQSCLHPSDAGPG